jgi:hypothetical protein
MDNNEEETSQCRIQYLNHHTIIIGICEKNIISISEAFLKRRVYTFKTSNAILMVNFTQVLWIEFKKDDATKCDPIQESLH